MNYFAKVILLMAVICLLSGCGGKSAEGVVKDYISALSRGDVPRAKSLCTSKARKTFDNIQVEFEVGAAMRAGQPDMETDMLAPKPLNIADLKFKTEEVEVEEEGEESDSTLIIVTAEDQEVTFRMGYREGRWMISSISNPLFGLEHLIEWE